MKYPAIPLAQTILQLCKANHINHVVISPGSRNAPLTIGFSHDEYFTCHSVVDERVAAFFAMGMAQQLHHPVAIVCTSGSALLNYYPAIAEAFYSNIPIVVISADRPENKIDIGDGQTIRQPNVFANHILYSANLRQDIPFELNISGDGKHQDLPLINAQQIQQEYNEQEISKAIHTAILTKGPVHINAPFEEPLYKTLEKPTVTVKAYPLPVHQEEISVQHLETFQKEWNSAKRKMILVGVLAPDSIEDKFLQAIANDESVVVFTETTSNLHHNKFFSGIDKVLAPVEKESYFLEALQPDILLTFGGMIVSKKIKAFLRNYQPKKHYHVDEVKAYDTFFCLTHHFKIGIQNFLSNYATHLQPVASNYQPFWLAIQEKNRKQHAKYVAEIAYSDFLVYEYIFEHLPGEQLLHLSNSSTIRYAQLFEINEKYKIYCNRGTSGIDGTTSTAVGAATIAKEATTLISGDLSFLYDSNGLWNTIRPDFTIIVINNGGGGIFRILPGEKNTPEFDKYFETKHHLNASHLAEMYGFEYKSAYDIETVKEVMQSTYEALTSRTKPVIFEVFTPRLQNDEILLNYFKYLGQTHVLKANP